MYFHVVLFNNFRNIVLLDNLRFADRIHLHAIQKRYIYVYIYLTIFRILFYFSAFVIYRAHRMFRRVPIPAKTFDIKNTFGEHHTAIMSNRAHTVGTHIYYI